jgi:uncharacterized protein YggE
MMKRKLRYIGVLVLVASVLSSCGQAGAPLSSPGETASVAGSGNILPSGQFSQGLVVVGTGTASAEPEIARVTFGVELRGDDPVALVDEAATKVDGAITAAKGLGIADTDVQTVSYSLWVETVTDPQTGAPTGEVVYHLSHYVQVTLRDLTQVGELLAAVIEAGANTISGVEFTVEDPDALVEQALQEALQDAQARAERMAETLGAVVGQPVLVEEIGGGYPTSIERASSAVAPSVAAPPISPGVFSVSVSVQVVYRLP